MYRTNLSWDSSIKIREGSEEEFDLIKQNILCFKHQKQEYFGSSGDLYMTIDEIEFLVQRGFVVEIKDFKNCYTSIKGWQEKLNKESNITHIHIPNIGLLAINKVKVLENICTDTLQDNLNKGWRIIAVCPPDGVRRPDYILGKTVAEG